MLNLRDTLEMLIADGQAACPLSGLSLLVFQLNYIVRCSIVQHEDILYVT